MNDSRCFVLYGEEIYLRDIRCGELISKIASDGDENSPNIGYYDDNYNIELLKEDGNVLPFFADKRLILLRLSSPQKISNELVEYIHSSPSYLYFIIVLESTNINSKLTVISELNKFAVLENFTYKDEAFLSRWILGYLQKNRKKIKKESMNYLISRLGNEMTNIKNEVIKLVNSVDGEEITINDIDKITNPKINDRIFDFVTYVLTDRLDIAVNIYMELRLLKKQNKDMLHLINRELSLLVHISFLYSEGNNLKDISSKAGINYFILKNKYINLIKKFDKKILIRALDKGLNIENDIRTGKINNDNAFSLILGGELKL